MAYRIFLVMHAHIIWKRMPASACPSPGLPRIACSQLLPSALYTWMSAARVCTYIYVHVPCSSGGAYKEVIEAHERKVAQQIDRDKDQQHDSTDVKHRRPEQMVKEGQVSTDGVDLGDGVRGGSGEDGGLSEGGRRGGGERGVGGHAVFPPGFFRRDQQEERAGQRVGVALHTCGCSLACDYALEFRYIHR